MSLGPVFYIEMLTVGRRTRYVVTRVLYGLILLFLMGFCYSVIFDQWHRSQLQQQAEFAYVFFLAFSWVQLIGVLFMTPAMVAGTIAGEHERRTIDYLLTTSLYDTEITLGKFTARMLAIAAQLAVGIPILAIAMTLGGIAPEQLVRSFTISLVTLLSVGGLCLNLSTRSRTSREAIVRAYVILVALMIIPPILWFILQISDVQVGRETLRVVTELNPIYFMYLNSTQFFSGLMLIEFWHFVAVHLTAAVVLAGSSVFGLRRFYMKQAGKAPPKQREKKDQPSKRWALVAPYSMMWKELVAGRGAIRLGILGRIAAFGLYALALWGLGYVVWEQFDSYDYRDTDAPHIYGTGAVPVIASLCILLVAGRAAGSVTAEREQDTWTTLVSTPLPGREIVWAKFVAAVYSVRWWYYVIFADWLCCAYFMPQFLWALPLLAIVHLIVLAMTAAIGVLCSLNSTTSLRAMGMTLAVVVLALSIAPLFFSIMTHSPTFLGFSLPVLLGGVHLVLWEATSSSMGRYESDFAAMLTGAAMLYGVATLICYSVAVVNFDALIGRTVPKMFSDGVLLPTATPANAERVEEDVAAVAELATEPPAEPEQRA